MTENMIVWPMILMAFATMLIYIPLVRARIKSVTSGEVKPGVYKLNQGLAGYSLQLNNALGNQYEAPVLFYAACLAAHVSGNATRLMVGLAFAYVIAKILHIVIHITSNKIPLRLAVFSISMAILLGMWITLAYRLWVG